MKWTFWFFVPALVWASADLDGHLKQIFGSEDFKVNQFGPARWIEDGAAYTTLEAGSIVRYETASGRRTVLVATSQLRPPNAVKPLDVEDYAWSADSQRLLIFTAAKNVWRLKTRGDYWVLDRS